MDSLAKSNNDDISTSPVLQATLEDMNCFASFVSQLGNFHSRDGVTCVAPPAKWSENYFLLSNATEMKMKRQLLPQLLFASPYVVKNVKRDQCKVRKDRSVDIQDNRRRVCDYPFLTSKACSIVGAHQRPSMAWDKTYRSFLSLSSKIDSSNDDAFNVRNDEVAFWKLMHEGFKHMTAEF